MGWRFNRTFGKSVRVNVSTSGVSLGTSIPGTGISYNTGSFGWGRRRSGSKGGWGQLAGRLVLVLVLAGAVWYVSTTFGKKAKHGSATAPASVDSQADLSLNSESSPPVRNATSAADLPLPKYAVSKTHPQYVRAFIKPGKFTQAEISHMARMVRDKIGQTECQIDFFSTSRPLDWAGGTKLTDHLKTLLICQVSVSNDEENDEFKLGEYQGPTPGVK